MSEEFKETRGEKHSVARLAFTAISRKVVGKNVPATIPKGNMGYDQYAVPDTVAVESSILLSFSTLKHMSMASRAILSNFFEQR